MERLRSQKRMTSGGLVHPQIGDVPGLVVKCQPAHLNDTAAIAMRIRIDAATAFDGRPKNEASWHSFRIDFQNM